MRDYQISFVEQELMPLSLEGKRLLEIGAGEGEICRDLLARVPSIRQVVGINVEDRAPESGPGWKLLTMDACELTFADESFVVVY